MNSAISMVAVISRVKDMEHCCYTSLLGLMLALLFSLVACRVFGGDSNVRFDENYKITWGYDHGSSLNQGTEVQLSMDNSSGAGFGSKLNYGSGLFHLRIKLPGKDSAGVVTAFYLTSQGNKHDELDFEFLGNGEGKPIYLQTNVFADGVGNREQRISLWFDPTADFHDYRILWNHNQIVFYVDNVPIREFKNNKGIGVGYPSKAMQVQASLWNGERWATDGGQTKINWTMAPFNAHFQGFDISGCTVTNDRNSNNNNNNTNIQQCYSSKYWWNSVQYWKLDSNQQRELEDVRKKYMSYDYCSDRPRFSVPPPECPLPSSIANFKKSKGENQGFRINKGT